MQSFFINKTTQTIIAGYLSTLNSLITENQFEIERNKYLKQILNNFINSPERWDKSTQVSIKEISESFLHLLQENNPDKEGVDSVFSMCFRFLLEFYIGLPGGLRLSYSQIKSFAVHELNHFSEQARYDIEYALREMPISILKDIMHGEDFTSIRALPLTTKRMEELKSDWDKEINDRIKRVEALEATIKDQENKYNFVGLFKGFSDLSDKKTNECFWAKLVLFLLGFSIPASIAIEACYFHSIGFTIKSYWDLIELAPAISLIFIFAYYFRVSLRYFSSLKAQIIQIELRKTLCQFIQTYAEYSNGMKSKEHNPLERFEDIIFSSIVITEDKIPSTFDGLDQLAGVIKAIKGSK